MTKLLEDAVKVVRGLPADTQDDIARAMLALAEVEAGEAAVTLSDTERQAIAISRQAAANGEFATDAQVAAVWAKHGL